MFKSKILAAYLPQFHETEDNNAFWGKGYTDWMGVKNAKPQYKGHKQPRVPLNNNYYDLSDIYNIRWQAEIAKEYGIDGFNIYHYWFKDGKQELEKPAELLLSDPSVDIQFMFSWDNASWIRSWSNIPGGNPWAPAFDDKPVEESSSQATRSMKDDTQSTTVEKKTSTAIGSAILQELDYGDEVQWKKHFDYLLQFFKDDRYIKIDGKPVFAFMKSGDKEVLVKMRDYWKKLAVENGLPGLYLISSRRNFCEPHLFDNIYSYEPVTNGWGKRTVIEVRLKKYFGIDIKSKCPVKLILDYEKYWQKIIRFSEKNRNKPIFLGGLVNFDDTPRRGKNARIIEHSSPALFEKYFRELYRISCESNKELLFLNGWNEWGEGAYMEPDEEYGYQYLEALKRAIGR